MKRGHSFKQLPSTAHIKFFSMPAKLMLALAGVVLLGTRPAPLGADETSAGENPERILTTADRPDHEVRMRVAAADRTAVSASLLAPVITATKTDVIVGDAGSIGIADPGETIRYTVTITNSGDMDAENVSFDDTISPNTTLVGGSVDATPLAHDDFYDALGNLGITVPVGAGVLVNDNDPDGGTVTLTEVQGSAANIGTATATTNTGSVTVAADGSFTYDPPVGFSGTDTFTYTIDDDEGNSDNGTVTILVDDQIWFVDNSVSGGGNNGTLADPFESLADFETANGGGATSPGVGDCIFIFDGSGDYTGGVTLLDAQTLVGEGTSSSLDTACDVTLPTYSSPLPTPGGTDPVIVNAGGNGITLASGNTIRGLTVGNTLGAGIIGSSFVTLTTDEVTISGTGQALDLDTGALAASFDAISSTSSSGDGIDIDNVSNGSFEVTGATSLTGISGDGISLTSNSTVTFTFAAVNVTTTTGAGISANNSGTISVSGTASSIHTTTGTGLNVNQTTIGPAGLNFESISVSGATNGIVLNNTGTSGGLSVIGNGSGAPNGTGGTLNTTGDAISLTSTDGFSLSSMNIPAPGGDGIKAVNITGTNEVLGFVTTNVPASQDGIDWSGNTATTTTAQLTVSASEFTGLTAATGNRGISLETGTLAYDATLVVNNDGGGAGDCLFERFQGSSIVVAAGTSSGTGTVDVTVEDCTVQNAEDATLGNSGLDFGMNGSADLTVLVDNVILNTVGRGAGDSGVINFSDGTGATGTFDITVQNSQITDSNREGISVKPISSTATFDITFDNNVMDDIGRAAIHARFDAGSSGDVTITNNDLGTTTPVGGTTGSTRDGIILRIRDGGVSDLPDCGGVGSTCPSGTMTALVDNNEVVLNNTRQAIDIVVEDASFANLTVTNNTAENQSTGDQFAVDAEDAGSDICLDLRLNSAVGPGTFDLTESAGTFEIEGATTNVVTNTDITNANTVGTGNISGTIQFNGGADCATPSLAAKVDGSDRRRLASLSKTGTSVSSVGPDDDTIDFSATWISADMQPSSTSARPNSELLLDGFVTNDVSETSESQLVLLASASDPALDRAVAQRQRILDRLEAEPLTFAEQTGKEVNRTAVGAASSAVMSPLSGENINISIGTLNPGKSVTITFDVTVDNPLPDGVNEVCNQGVVEAKDLVSTLTDDPATGSTADPTCTPTLAGADLTLTKDDGDASVVPGGTIAYTLTYENVGGQDATGVEITDMVPANTMFHAGSPSTAGWTCVPDNTAGSTCTLPVVGTVAAGGGSGTATFAVDVVNPVPAGTGLISNSASISHDGSGGVDPNPGDNSDSDTTPVVAEPVIVVTKADFFVNDGNGDGIVDPGETIEYTIVITNTGDEDASAVVFADDAADHPNATLVVGSVIVPCAPGCVTKGNVGLDTDVSVNIGALAGAVGNVEIKFRVTVDTPFPSGETQVCNQGTVTADGGIMVKSDDEDVGGTEDPTCTAVGINQAPEISNISLDNQTVQYSDKIVEVMITATDDDKPNTDPLALSSTWTDDGGVTTNVDLPSDLMLSAATCTGTTDRQCTWTLSGQMQQSASTIEIDLVVDDGALSSAPDVVTILVEPEDVVVVFDSDNPAGVQVENPGDPDSGPTSFGLSFDLSEFEDPKGEDDANLAGDITKAKIVDSAFEPTVSLVPVGPGGAVPSLGCAELAPVTPCEDRPDSCTEDPDSPYDYEVREITCLFANVPVNTYAVTVDVNEDGYYEGVGEDVFVIFDPSLGFTTGGGWFYWPGTENPGLDYLGDKTKVGYGAKYNKKGNKVQGSLLLIRHLDDGTYFRVKSNAMHGLSVGEDSDGDGDYGWASFFGKATYKEPTWSDPIGNHEFTAYVEDRGTPGGGEDRFWIEVNDGDGMPTMLVLSTPAPAHAVTIEQGNFVVPQGKGKGTPRRKFGEEIPEEFALHPSYPNPFNPTTTITLDVPEESEVSMRVYDILGRQVRVLLDGSKSAGVHRVVFEADTMPSGVYIVLAETPVGRFTQMMLLVK